MSFGIEQDNLPRKKVNYIMLKSYCDFDRLITGCTGPLRLCLKDTMSRLIASGARGQDDYAIRYGAMATSAY